MLPSAWRVGKRVSLGVKEWVSDGVEFLAAKNAKFAKASNLRKAPLFDLDF